jgi:glycosyltransferase involved in cell wall biosynthesis
MDTGQDPAAGDQPPRVSIIVPVRNGADTITECITALQRQTLPAHEIIVIDNGSTDDTVKSLEPFDIRLLHEAKRGSYAARNTGLRSARGDLVYFTDADCVAPPDTLKRLVGTLLERDVAGVGGQVLTSRSENWVARFSDVAGFLTSDRLRGEVARSPHIFLSGGLLTANVLYRRSVFDAVGQFDESLLSGGDYEMCWRILAAGHRLFFEPEAHVRHRPRLTLRRLARQFYTYGFWQPRLLRRQPERRNYIRLKTYILPHFERGFAGRLRVLLDIDIIHWLLLLGAMALLTPVLGFWCLLPLAVLLAGVAWQTLNIVRRTRCWAWLVLFPALHVIRSAAFTIGRIHGGIRARVLAC